MNNLVHALRRFIHERRGFAAAEAVLLACLLGAACIAVGRLLQEGATIAADNVDHEIATGAPR